MRIILLSLFLLLSNKFVHAQVSTPKYANEFLNLGAGARGMGLGNTQTAIVDDVTAGYWNPAGLVRQTMQYEGILQHSEYFAGIAKYDYLSFGAQLDSLSNLGFSVIRFGIDDIPDTRFLYDANGAINYDNIRFFSAADYAFIATYARKLKLFGLNNFSIGGNLKVIHRSAGEFAKAWGFGLDIGTQFKLKDWQIGLVLKDITGTFTAWTHKSDLVFDIYSQTGNTIPSSSIEVAVPRVVLGVGRYFQIKKFGILPTLDFTSTFDGKRNTLIKSNLLSIDPTIGLEINYAETAFLRFGGRNYQELKNFDGSTYPEMEPTFGIGVKYRVIKLDYALTNVGEQTESIYSHVFSLILSLKGKQ